MDQNLPPRYLLAALSAKPDEGQQMAYEQKVACSSRQLLAVEGTNRGLKRVGYSICAPL